MPKIQYENVTFRGLARDIIDKANVIIEEYAAQGFNMTLRQLYYQFISRDQFPDKWISKKPITLGQKNCQENYDKLGVIITNGRRAGLIDWEAIDDLTRRLKSSPTWDSPADIIASAASGLRYHLWADQPRYVEVWFEKDALANVMTRACNEWRLPFFACRGYGSDSAMWQAAQRLTRHIEAGREVIILHFGDHDPSGIDMTRDIEARLALFGAGDVDVRRLALNMDQVRKYRPPPNPAKELDCRFAGYVAKFGRKCWELDALSPPVMMGLVKANITKLIDMPKWEAKLAEEAIGRVQMEKLSAHWPRVAKFVNKIKSK